MDESMEVRKFFFKNKELVRLDGVYDPQEDSILLTNAVKVRKETKALDIGCGTGIQSVNMALQGANVLAADINDAALRNTKITAETFGVEKLVKTRKSDLFSNIKKDEKFDFIVFNPPYVPSTKIKYTELDGGKKGRIILDKFINEFAGHLNEKGVCYFLQSSLNGIKNTEEKLEKQNLKFEIVAKQRIFFEEIIVFKATKK
ncbi:MAG: protoporphyrinogen oxidase [Candidatus Diapherotrites archaeon CG08_land_8_20_14_0_20_34_12]|nr:MAG: protoporphyrinogen oxidase [Candidatus Diapherotrites archaeon CG08_land_8_20_14_0_20_34_12]